MKWLASYMKYPLQSDLFSSLSSFPPLFSLLFFSFFFFLDYLHVSCPPMVTQSRSSLNPETSPAFVGRCCIAGRDECDESFENSAKTNLFSFFLREVSLQFWILFFFLKKNWDEWHRIEVEIQREEFCRVIEISYGFFFPSKLKLKLFFFSSSSSSPFPRDLIVFNCQGNLWSEEWKKLYTRQLAKISARRKNTIDLSN